MVFKYVKRESPAAKKKAGISFKAVGKKPKLGEGGRFSALKSALSKKGASSPGALAAWIGRKKLGGKKMGKLSAMGRKGK